MLEQVVLACRYGVRAVGLVIVVAVSVFTLYAAIFSAKPSAMVAVASGLAIAASVLSWPRIPNGWRRDPPTEKQLAYAEALGLPVPDGITKGQLSDMISQATGR